MTDNFKEIGSLFGREGAGAGFAKQTDKESFTYAFAWPEGDTWATLTGYLNLDEQPEEYVRRVLQDGGFRSDWGNPDYDPIGDFKRNSDGMKPADCGGLFANEDFALLCWDSVNHLPAIRRISLKASLTSRLIDFKYLREAEAPAYTHGVSNDTFDYEFDDDDDDIPAFSVPEA